MSKSCEGYLWTESESVQGLTTDAVVQSTSALKSHYDVVIVGAGFAGLIACRELSRCGNGKDLKILMLEGRDRIGGRTWTAKALGEEFEMGGTWVHWNQPHVYSELHRYNLHKNLKTSAGTVAAEHTYYKPSGGPVVEVDGAECAEIQQTVANSFFEIDGLTSRDLMPYPHDPFRVPAPWKKYDHLTVRQRLNQLGQIPNSHKDLFESVVNSFGSAPGSQTGFVEALRWYALGGHSLAGVFELAGIYKVGKGGMTSFARAIFGDCSCDMLSNTIVTDITQTSGGTLVRTKGGQSFNAAFVISTIPLNCLGDVKFSPPLSLLKREAIKKGHINQGAKIHFKLARAEPGWFAFCNGCGDSPFCFAFSDHNGTSSASSPDATYCIGFGYNGHLQDKEDNETIIREFQRNIRPGAEVQAYLTHDWMNDPLAKGVWSCWGPHSTTRYLPELQVRHGNVLFASGDWADGWRGFVDGAIESGRKAAAETLKLLAESSTFKSRARL
ncbi:hypothetical protein PV11_06965 [Exophiala sideris]|uniref:Amine oxidase n=1 Tax=Exophiala sideris TaxID=1016849 RepID=A0A0D1YX83_9EURO|nr:hypothetical protein PV11_06965 [Exophiala sideris]